MTKLTRVFVAMLLYVAGYAVFRQANSEVWAKDKRTYVIYSDTLAGRALYYAWRPLAYVDGTLTGRASHIGPHR